MKYEWEDFYKEFAEKLLSYKNNREEIISRVKRAYENIDINLPTLEKDENSLNDIDPFTVFGLFNKGIRDDNKIRIMTELGRQFNMQTEAPNKFDGLPVLNNTNATFYHFTNVDYRNPNDKNDLWELFESALKYGDDPSDVNRKTVSKYFDLTINKKGNGTSKITMGLYWIAPDTFISLDEKDKIYLYQSGKIPSEVIEKLPEIDGKISSEDYFMILNILKDYLGSNTTITDFKDLSYEAWKYSEEVNKQRKEIKSGLGDDDVVSIKYWIYSPEFNSTAFDECFKDGVMAIGFEKIGNLSSYNTKDEMAQAMNDKYKSKKSYRKEAKITWEFAKELKIGDVVFVKKEKDLIVRKGIVKSEYYYDETITSEYKNRRKVDWSNEYEYDVPSDINTNVLTDISSYSGYVDKLNKLFEDSQLDEHEFDAKDYTPDNFLEDVFMSSREYCKLTSLIKKKKNVILQGAPGVGKTYVAKRLAYSMIGMKNAKRVMMVQFHQNYSYEDFIEGIRPNIDGDDKNLYVIKKGRFYEFCKTAIDDSENEYFFIIDEINRGNLSKIFGELFMLIENDKRGPKNSIQLLYSGEKFYVPEKLYIIGMMNTADRSLAFLDYALRRRFAFYEMRPSFDSDGFIKYKTKINNEKFNRLIDCVIKLNDTIANDESLGDGFCVGHSYFCELENVNDLSLSEIVEYELIPLLKEYWFDEPKKVKDWADQLRNSIK